MAVHPECILDQYLTVAEDMIVSGEIPNHDEDWTLGTIALTRKCLERIPGTADCEQPVLDQSGQFVCPFRDATYSLRTMVTQITVSHSAMSSMSELNPHKKVEPAAPTPPQGNLYL